MAYQEFARIAGIKGHWHAYDEGAAHGEKHVEAARAFKGGGLARD